MRTAHHGAAAHRSPFVALTAVMLTIPAVAGTTAASASGPEIHSNTSARGPSLVGRAVLPVGTLADGPQSGAVDPAGRRNGSPSRCPRSRSRASRRSSTAAAPVSSWPCPTTATAPRPRRRLPDPRLLRPARLQDRGGGTGDVQVGDFIPFRDPDRRIGFPIVNEATTERLLTGGDIDPESLQRGP